VYTTDVCPWCTRVKSYLRQNDVQFREINVQHDASAARRMVERSGQQGVPQVDIDGRVVVGFDKGKIDALLGLSARSA
jgi:glutaredoxin-like YruB-family protein